MFLAISCAGASIVASILIPLVTCVLYYAGAMNMLYLIIGLALTWLCGVCSVLAIRWFKAEHEEYWYIKELEKEFKDGTL